MLAQVAQVDPDAPAVADGLEREVAAVGRQLRVVGRLREVRAPGNNNFAKRYGRIGIFLAGPSGARSKAIRVPSPETVGL